MWLHSSVGRASHRYRGGHGFESRWSPDFLRLLLSNCLNWKFTAMIISSLFCWDKINSQLSEIVIEAQLVPGLIKLSTNSKVRLEQHVLLNFLRKLSQCSHSQTMFLDNWGMLGTSMLQTNRPAHWSQHGFAEGCLKPAKYKFCF